MILKKQRGVRKAAKQELTPPKHQLLVDGNVIHFPSSLPKKQDQTCFVFVPLRVFGARVIDFVRQQKVLTLSERAVWRELSLFAGTDGTCFPSQELLAERAGIHERTVRKALHSLEKKGFIVKLRPGKYRSCSYYFLFHPVFIELKIKPNKTDHRAALPGSEGLEFRPAKPPIPNIPEKESIRTPTSTVSACGDPCAIVGSLSGGIEEMILQVALTKQHPAKWAFKVRKSFREGVGDFESLKNEADEIIKVKGERSLFVEDKKWSLLLSELIKRDGLDLFKKKIKTLSRDFMQIESETIPMSYVADYLENAK